MNLRSPRVRFTLSLLAALAAGAATWRTIDEARRDPSRAPMMQVLVVRKPSPAGRVISADMVERRAVPAPFVEPGAFHDAGELSGGRARIPLARGEQLTRSKIESASSRLGLAWSLPPGATALGLRLAAENAAGGHVLPGDFVAVLAAPARDAGFRAIVPQARVVAVHDRVWDASAAPASPGGLGSNDSILVTLMLTPEQANRVATFVERGRLTLALLSSLDEPARGGSNAH